MIEDRFQFVDPINKKSSYYAENAFRYTYSELAFLLIITAVNDPDFNYVLNETVACYDQSLYLKAVSTVGTALEKLIIKILIDKNIFTNEKYYRIR